MVSVTQLILTLFFKVTQEIFIIGSKKPQVVENKVAFRFPRRCFKTYRRMNFTFLIAI